MADLKALTAEQLGWLLITGEDGRDMHPDAHDAWSWDPKRTLEGTGLVTYGAEPLDDRLFITPSGQALVDIALRAVNAELERQQGPRDLREQHERRGKGPTR